MQTRNTVQDVFLFLLAQSSFLTTTRDPARCTTESGQTSFTEMHASLNSSRFTIFLVIRFPRIWFTLRVSGSGGEAGGYLGPDWDEIRGSSVQIGKHEQFVLETRCSVECPSHLMSLRVFRYHLTVRLHQMSSDKNATTRKRTRKDEKFLHLLCAQGGDCMPPTSIVTMSP